MKFTTILSVVLAFALATNAQMPRSENIVVITLDGFRWQELYTGADSTLAFTKSPKYNAAYVQSKYWLGSREARRQKLMPFMWSEIEKNGVLLGNRHHRNYANVANRYWFSYPGYNEIFTGFPDTGVNSNDKVPNPNQTVFEYLNKRPEFKNKAAVVASWDVFEFIFNEKRSGLFVNNGFEDVPGTLNERQTLYNKLQHELPDLFHGPAERLDVATFNIGLEYMKANKPRLMYFGFGDTDEFAHAGLYDYYLDAANKTDQWIAQIWQYVQSDPFYAGKTTLLITTDHGRGAAENGEWTSHGAKISGASEIWMAAIGASVKASGEQKAPGQVQQGQVAATIAAMLGVDFKPAHTTLPPLFFNK